MCSQMPQEGGIWLSQAKFNRIVIQLAHALHVVSELQAIKVGKAVAIDVVPRMVAVKYALEGKYHIICI